MVKRDNFRHSKYHHSATFYISFFPFCAHIHQTCIFKCITVKKKSIMVLGVFIFLLTVLTNFRTVKIRKIRYCSLIGSFISHLLLQANRFIFKAPCLIGFPENTYFWLKLESMTPLCRHLRPTCQSEPVFFGHDVPNWSSGRYWISGDDPFVTFMDIVENERGAKWSQPLPVAD